MRKLFIKQGEIYGKYKALEELVYTNPSGTTEKRWKCENIETGEISYKRARALDCKTQSDLMADEVNAMLVKNNMHQMGIRKSLYTVYKSNARNRGYDFNLTLEEFNSLITQPCHYCGQEPEVLNGGSLSDRRDKSQPNLYTNGIDRIDSTKGYTVENCVPCCSKCNLMKNTYSVDEFLNHVKKISDFNFKEGSTTIESTSNDVSK